jgi:hypothetical protein
MNDPAEDFFEVCTTSFDFLVGQFGFKRRAKKRDAGVFRVPYEGALTKVEIGFEWRDQYVYVLLGRRDGARAGKGEATPRAAGEITAFNLEDLLSLRAPGRGVDESVFGRALTREDFEHVCGTYSAALREHAADVLRGDFSVLPQVAKIVRGRMEKFSRR